VTRPPRDGETPPRPASGEPGVLHLVLLGEHVYSSHRLPPSGEVILGRGTGCDVVIADDSVSRRHACLRIGSPLSLEDLGSANGTRVQGRTLARGERAEFALGEAVQIGTIMAVVRDAGVRPRPRRLWPHGYFEGRLDEECEVSARSGAAFAVVRLRASAELDGAALIDALSGVLRSGDVVGQAGPGDFEILLRELSRDQAARVVTRIPAALGPAEPTIAVGHACFPEDGTTAEELLAVAAAAAGAPRTVRGEPVPEGAMRDILRMADRVAASSLSVLILGETGVGKELLAEYLHRQSPRRDKPLLRLNCAALSPTLLESELFGHERGAFTGADRPKPGLLEGADGGSVFLDEIGELTEPLQVKLLRVIEERKVQRVGGLSPRPIDVRFIAATNRNLVDEVAIGRFRQDLLYRINAMTLVIPPLRQRVHEIAQLARVFADEIAKELGRDELVVAPSARTLLEAYPWPGNVRELRNIIMRAAVLSTGATIQPEHLPPELHQAADPPTTPSRRGERGATVAGALKPGTIRESVRKTVAEMERKAIMEALARHGGNQHAAARELGIHRRTLMRRLDQYEIPRPRKGVPKP
jgi:two-component system, NtrC family, response regulator AtoC